MDLEPNQPTEPGPIGSHLVAARLRRGLNQSELAARCGLSQAQISYFELDRRRPTLDQLLRIARSLDVSLETLIAGADRPGGELRDIAIELRDLGLIDLWVKDPVVPGAFRWPEEVIAQAVSGREPDPRIVEAIPALLVWNQINPLLLLAHGQATRPRVTRRLAWLADIALAIDRRGGFPGGCRKEPLGRFTRAVRAPRPELVPWDDLGRPMTAPPKSPIWRRWRINYDADLARFEQRARNLAELRGQSDGQRRREKVRRRIRYRIRIARKLGDSGAIEPRQGGSEDVARHPTGRPTLRGHGTSGRGRRDGE